MRCRAAPSGQLSSGETGGGAPADDMLSTTLRRPCERTHLGGNAGRSAARTWPRRHTTVTIRKAWSGESRLTSKASSGVLDSRFNAVTDRWASYQPGTDDLCWRTPGRLPRSGRVLPQRRRHRELPRRLRSGVFDELGVYGALHSRRADMCLPEVGCGPDRTESIGVAGSRTADPDSGIAKTFTFTNRPISRLSLGVEG